MTLPWTERPTIDLDLHLPVERRFDDIDDGVLQKAQDLLATIQQEIPPIARQLAYWIRLRTGSRFQREAVAMARRVDVDWRDIVVAAVSYELVLAAFGCSTVALATPEGPVLARNMDWAPEGPLAKASFLFRFVNGPIAQMTAAGWPGALGIVTGMSSRGFAVALNAVLSSEGIRKTGYPVMLHLRRVLDDARDFGQAVEWLTTQRLACSALLTVVGTTNDQRVVVERTPTRHAVRAADGDGPLLATNHYRLLSEATVHDPLALDETTCSRYEALECFWGRHDPARPVTDEQLLYCLSDERVIQGITAQHIIARPRANHMRLFVPTHLLQEHEDAA